MFKAAIQARLKTLSPYKAVRAVHLYAGLTLVAFVVMYFVTGVLITEPELRPGKEAMKVVGQLHRQHGYGGGGLKLVWAVMVDVASVAMIVFAGSGVYLWYRSTRVRWPGWVLLGVSFAYAGGVVGYVLWSR